jgi:pimeloyl-ACP methyl ester carboxylesterase
MLRLVLCFGLSAVSFAACGSDPDPDPISPEEPAPEPAVAPISWTPCEADFECGSVSVPIDYSAPQGPSLTIAVKRLRATGERSGVLMLNPGGPGVSATAALADLSEALSPALRARFDLVAFDPRGVGSSDALDCHSTARSFIAVDVRPESDAEMRSVEQSASSFAAECESKHAALLPHLGTANVARDMDRVRAALGEQQINYIGFSYGSVLGAWYAELFPERVRSLVLDGGIDLDGSALELGLQQGENFERGLAGYLAWCKAGAARCPWTEGRDPAEAFSALRTRLRTQPIPAQSADRPAGINELALGVAYMLYGGGQAFEYLTVVLSDAAKSGGDGSGLVGLADRYVQRQPDGSYTSLLETTYAVNCLDRSAPTAAEVREAQARFETAAPTFGPTIWGGLMVCAHWTRPARLETPPRNDDLPQILVLGTTRDPVLPYAWAEKLAGDLSGTLLTLDADGHTAYARGYPCVDAAVDTYLLEAKPPAAGTHCQ